MVAKGGVGDVDIGGSNVTGLVLNNELLHDKGVIELHLRYHELNTHRWNFCYRRANLKKAKRCNEIHVVIHPLVSYTFLKG